MTNKWAKGTHGIDQDGVKGIVEVLAFGRRQVAVWIPLGGEPLKVNGVDYITARVDFTWRLEDEDEDGFAAVGSIHPVCSLNRKDGVGYVFWPAYEKVVRIFTAVARHWVKSPGFLQGAELVRLEEARERAVKDHEAATENLLLAGEAVVDAEALIAKAKNILAAIRG